MSYAWQEEGSDGFSTVLFYDPVIVMLKLKLVIPVVVDNAVKVNLAAATELCDGKETPVLFQITFM